MALTVMRSGETFVAAIAALRSVGKTRLPPQALLEALAQSLIKNDDVNPIACIA